MKNKKGFTLVELLAVIAILAILVIMALPAVLRMFNSARKDSFTNEVNTVLRTARQQYLLSGGTQTTWSNATGSTSTLDLTGNSHLQYYVKMNNEGKITKIQVTNGDFQYNVTNNNGIDVASSNDVQEVTEENALVISATEPNTTIELYFAEGNSYNTYQEAVAAYGHPFFVKKVINTNTWCITEETEEYNSCASGYYLTSEESCLEELNNAPDDGHTYTCQKGEVWCMHGSNDWNSCDLEPYYFKTEGECQEELNNAPDDGNTYTCQKENLSIAREHLGFVKNGNMYLLTLGNSNLFAENKNILNSAFGESNCQNMTGCANGYQCTADGLTVYISRSSRYASAREGSTSISTGKPNSC